IATGAGRIACISPSLAQVIGSPAQRALGRRLCLAELLLFLTGGRALSSPRRQPRALLFLASGRALSSPRRQPRALLFLTGSHALSSPRHRPPPPRRAPEAAAPPPPHRWPHPRFSPCRRPHPSTACSPAATGQGPRQVVLHLFKFFFVKQVMHHGSPSSIKAAAPNTGGQRLYPSSLPIAEDKPSYEFLDDDEKIQTMVSAMVQPSCNVFLS
ncbi:unnamed protein product, partial [Urochloa humidicola]